MQLVTPSYTSTGPCCPVHPMQSLLVMVKAPSGGLGSSPPSVCHDPLVQRSSNCAVRGGLVVVPTSLYVATTDSSAKRSLDCTARQEKLWLISSICMLPPSPRLAIRILSSRVSTSLAPGSGQLFWECAPGRNNSSITATAKNSDPIRSVHIAGGSIYYSADLIHSTVEARLVL